MYEGIADLQVGKLFLAVTTSTMKFAVAPVSAGPSMRTPLMRADMMMGQIGGYDSRFSNLHFATKVDQIQLLLDLALLRSHFTIFLGTVLSCMPCIFLPAKIAILDALQSLSLCIGDGWDSGGTIV